MRGRVRRGLVPWRSQGTKRLGKVDDHWSIHVIE